MNIYNQMLSIATRVGVRDLAIELDKHVYIHYAGNGDPAHGMSHIRQVVRDGLQIVKWCGDNGITLPMNAAKLVVLAAFYHDWYTGICRGTHHVLAHDMILTRDPGLIGLDELDEEEVLTVSAAVHEHRASASPEKYHDVVAEIVAAADRGAPDANTIIARGRLIGFTDSKLAHITLRKYGSGGYVKFPAIYTEFYGVDKIACMHADIDKWCESHLSNIR